MSNYTAALACKIVAEAESTSSKQGSSQQDTQCFSITQVCMGLELEPGSTLAEEEAVEAEAAPVAPPQL